jgi:hypothetical protein
VGTKDLPLAKVIAGAVGKGALEDGKLFLGGCGKTHLSCLIYRSAETLRHLKSESFRSLPGFVDRDESPKTVNPS